MAFNFESSLNFWHLMDDFGAMLRPWNIGSGDII
jgi:hypothetical protein